MTSYLDFVDVQVECDAHGAQTVKRLRASDGTIHRSRDETECPICLHDQQRIEDLRERERTRSALTKRLVNGAGLPTRYKETTFADYTTNSSTQKRALEICQRYVASIISKSYPGWLVLSGRPGTGKSMLLSCMAVELANNCIRSNYVTHTAMGREFRTTYQRGAERSENDLFNHYSNTPLLLLDELGASSTEHTDRLVFEILDARYADSLPVVIATNHPRGDLEHVVGERLFDRLKEEATFLAFDWGSSRKPAGLRNKATT